MTPPLSPPRHRLPALVAAAGLLTILLAGCTSGDGGDDSGATADSAVAERGTDGLAVGSPEAPAADDAGAEREGAAPARAQVAQQAVISTATVSLRSDDVADAVFDVQKVVDQYQGEVADEQTEGGDEARRSRMVLRMPSDAFDAALGALKQIGEVESSSRRSEDVTTQVIDTEVRIRAQERSLQRIELLLDRAETIRDIFAIERELTQRQGALDSLKSQQAYLADQTTLATITVHIERTEEPGDKPDTDETGFLPGLEDGWKALTTVGAGLATVAGAVLPFAVVLALLGLPVWRVVRRVLRRRPERPAASPAT